MKNWDMNDGLYGMTKWDAHTIEENSQYIDAKRRRRHADIMRQSHFNGIIYTVINIINT